MPEPMETDKVTPAPSKMSEIKSLEYPTLKVPYEILNKKFRAAQKNVDREVSHVTSVTADITQELPVEEGKGRKGEVDKIAIILDSMVDKICVLKRKAGESMSEELDAARVCKRRVEHLKDADTSNPTSLSLWKRKRLDRMLVDQFLRSGYYNCAIKLADNSDIRELTNIDLFLVSKEVEESLMNKDTSKCLAWCHDNKSRLRKMKSTLEFNLRIQEFIQLVKSDRRIEAIKHARKFCIGLEDEQIQDVQRCMGLLAYSVDTTIKPYADLLSEDRWQQLVSQFREENFRLYQLSNQSVFTVALQAGLSALKTPECYGGHKRVGNNECPVCSIPLNTMASPLPYAHCSRSRLICSVTGHLLDDSNPPMMLPNGYVYGEQTLVNLASENGGKVVCPRTKEVFDLIEAEKVFVM